jgi:hypothetical protein
LFKVSKKFFISFGFFFIIIFWSLLSSDFILLSSSISLFFLFPLCFGYFIDFVFFSANILTSGVLADTFPGALNCGSFLPLVLLGRTLRSCNSPFVGSSSADVSRLHSSFSESVVGSNWDRDGIFFFVVFFHLLLESEQQNLKVLDGNGLRKLLNDMFFISKDLSFKSIKDGTSVAVFLS